MEKILSFDCANKSFAITFLSCEINKNSNDNFQILNNLNIIYVNAIDLLPLKKVKEVDVIDRCYALCEYLDNLHKKINIEDINKIIIEYQMNTNDKSRVVSNQLIMYYLSKKINKNNIILIRPVLKNKLCLCIDGEYHKFLNKYLDTYNARKKHSEFNFINICKEKNIDISNINKKWLSDVGDSFMQIIAYLYFTNKKLNI